MPEFRPRGVFAAALTPLKADGTLDLDSVLPYLEFLAGRGCAGALLFGTTGEGPSFSLAERMALAREAAGVRASHPNFTLLMGTGTPSLSETVEITRGAFNLGMQGVVVLPPYFNRRVSDDGLFAWFSAVIQRGVPADGLILGYHIPQMSGVALSIELIDRIKTAFPQQFAGIKNSWTGEDFVHALGKRFGPELTVLTGFDNYFQLSLGRHAAGCITASASLISPVLRQVWERHQRGEDPTPAQREVNRVREIMDGCPPAPALLKALLARWHGFPDWKLCPPLIGLPEDKVAQCAAALGGPFPPDWSPA